MIKKFILFLSLCSLFFLTNVATATEDALDFDNIAITEDDNDDINPEW